MVELSGFLYNDAGAAVCGASVAVFPTACNVGATGGCATTSTTTNSSGFWTRSGIADGDYDVRITSGCSVRFIRFDNEQQVCRVEANTFKLGDANDSIFGASCDFRLRWSTGDASNHAAVIAVGDTSQQLHITDVGAIATDWARCAGTHPELAIHSNTDTATDYLAIGNHDGNNADLDVVGGTTLRFLIAGAVNGHLDACGFCTVTGNFYAINNTSVLNATTLGSGVTASSLTSVGTLTALTMGGDIDLCGNDIDDGGVIFLREQACADADVAGQGQIWVNTATPNELFFTDDAGTDHRIQANAVTALNNATANELLTVGATTTELCAEANLTFDGSTLTLTGAQTTTSHITLTNTGTASELRLREPSGGGCSYTSFKSPALAANVCYTLPADDGTACQVLQTNGCGVLTWATSSGVGQATVCQIKCETNNCTYVPPDLIKHSPGVAKAWGTMTSATVLQTPSYGLSGVGDDGTGKTTWSFSVNFSDIDYAPIGSGDSSCNGDINIDTDFPAAGSIQTQARSNNTEVDARMSITAFGEQ